MIASADAGCALSFLRQMLETSNQRSAGATKAASVSQSATSSALASPSNRAPRAEASTTLTGVSVFSDKLARLVRRSQSEGSYLRQNLGRCEQRLRRDARFQDRQQLSLKRTMVLGSKPSQLVCEIVRHVLDREVYRHLQPRQGAHLIWFHSRTIRKNESS